MTPDEEEYEHRPSRVVSLVITLVLGFGLLAMIFGILGQVQ